MHIHAKVHLDTKTVLTTQLYFDDALSDKVFAARPYSERGERDQRNDSDGIFEHGARHDGQDATATASAAS